VALLGLADSFIRSGKSGITPAIKCLRAIFRLLPPLPAFLQARTHLQLGVLLKNETTNRDLAKHHIEQAVRDHSNTAWHSRAGMHNIRPTGQMWPMEAFNLAREAPNCVYFACFFDKNTLWMCYNLLMLALGYVKNFLLAHDIWVVHPCSRGSRQCPQMTLGEGGQLDIIK